MRFGVSFGDVQEQYVFRIGEDDLLRTTDDVAMSLTDHFLLLHGLIIFKPKKTM